MDGRLGLGPATDFDDPNAGAPAELASGAPRAAAALARALRRLERAGELVVVDAGDDPDDADALALAHAIASRAADAGRPRVIVVTPPSPAAAIR